MSNSISHTNGRQQVEPIREYGAATDIGAEEGGSNGRLEKVMGDWRKLRVEETRDLFSSLNTTGDDQVTESEVGGTRSTNKREVGF